MKRILSGIKPSGEVTLGNYLGAMKRWAEISRIQEGEHFYFVPNLHALTVRPEPKELELNTLRAVAWLLTLGVDHKKSAIFVQSRVSAHSELGWILNNYVTMGELGRMTQFKDKSHKIGPEGQLVGLFDYPVLMAADILLYDADEVPVGDDQKQHVELARDIAERFNKLHGQTFKLPQAMVQEVGARIMNLQEPTKKMSKSDQDQSGAIMMMDKPDEVAAKIKRAVTDSGSEIKSDPSKPAVTNLLHIYSLLADKPVADIEKEYAGKGYGEFKADLADLAVGVIGSLQERYAEVMGDPDQLIAIINEGSEQASAVANLKLADVKAKIGLV